MSELFREIDDELRQDRIAAFWSRWSRLIVAAILVCVVAAGGLALWRNHRASLAATDSIRFADANALARSGKAAEAQSALAALSHESQPGFGLLARFQAAMLKVSTDRAGAAAAYQAIAADGSLDPLYRDLATLSAAYEAVDAQPAQTIQQLAPLTEATNPWRYSARELTAFAQLRTGNRKGALDLFKALSDDLGAPGAVRARAAEMTASLGQG